MRVLTVILLSFSVLVSCSDSGSSNKNPNVNQNTFDGEVIGVISQHNTNLCPNLTGSYKLVDAMGSVSFFQVSQVINSNNSITITTTDVNSGKKNILLVDGKVRKNSEGKIIADFCASSGSLNEMRDTENSLEYSNVVYSINSQNNMIIDSEACNKKTKSCTINPALTAYRQ